MESWQTARVPRRPVHIPDDLPSRTRALPLTPRPTYSPFRSNTHHMHSASHPHAGILFTRKGELMSHTLREVAKQAGVSPATVSRVLNKAQYIAPETEHRVLAVVRQLNYYKNVHARRLATGQSDLFGLVISEIANPYFPEIIRGFQASAWDRGFDVLLLNTEYQQVRTESVIRKLIESDVRGVPIMTSSLHKRATAELTPPPVAS